MIKHCVCNQCDNSASFYVCIGCKEDIPYCNGADDDLFDYCNDCAYKINHANPKSTKPSADKLSSKLPKLKTQLYRLTK